MQKLLLAFFIRFSSGETQIKAYDYIAKEHGMLELEKLVEEANKALLNQVECSKTIH